MDAYYTYSATNVRLQEARLTYTFPNKWFKGTVNNLSLSVYGTNLWMIYNKAPYDPELTASTGTFGQGYDYFMLPSQSTYGLSLNSKINKGIEYEKIYNSAFGTLFYVSL